VESREQVFRRVIKRALLSPLSLALISTTGLCAVVPATWLVSALGLLAEAVLLQLLIRDPRFVRLVCHEERQTDWRRQVDRLVRVRRSVDRETSALLGRIHTLQERLLHECPPESLDEAPYAPGLEDLGSLLERCVHLAEKRSQLRRYLDAAHLTDLQRQAGRLEARLGEVTDPVARRLYQQALTQKRSEMESYSAVEQALQRIDGQLEGMESSFGSLLGRLVRLRSAAIADLSLAQSQVSRQLADLRANLDVVESSVNEVLEVERRP
jgi:chromosome segregation ATPase